MKKLSVLLMLGICFGINGTDKLEEAIKESNLKEVETYVREHEITKKDCELLIDYAQQIVNKRKSEWECFKLRRNLPDNAKSEKTKKWGKAQDYLIFVMVASCFALPVGGIISVENKSGIGEALAFLGGTTCVASIFSIIYARIKGCQLYNDDRGNWDTKLQALYDDAMDIKNIILKYYVSLF